MDKTFSQERLENYVYEHGIRKVLDEAKDILLQESIIEDEQWIGHMILTILAEEMINVFRNIDYSESNNSIEIAFDRCNKKILRHIYPAINANIGTEKWIKIMEDIYPSLI